MYFNVYFLNSDMLSNGTQRKRLGVVGELEFRQPITEAQ